MKRVFRILFLVGFVALFVWTLYYLYEKSQETPMVSTVEKAFKATIIEKTVANGAVVPRKEIAVKPQVSGIVDEVMVEAGDQVVKGQVLARVRVIPDMVSLNNAENRLKQAQIDNDNAEQDFDRQKRLFDDEVISAQDFQNAQANFDRVKQELQAAQDNLQIIKEGALKKAGSVQNTLIRSTVKGMVLDVPVEEGFSVIEANTFNEGTTVATVADMTDMIFQGKVDESEVGKIKVGMPLLLSIGAIENVVYDAELEYIAPKGVEQNGAIQFDIKAAVQLSDSNFIRAGYSANADIVLAKVDSVLAIHESLLKFDEDRTYVLVRLDGEEFEERDIRTGLSDGIQIEVLNGVGWEDELKSGEVPVDEAGK